MSVIRHLLYNRSSIDALNSGILYNQTILHNFILQHQPRYILHCGSPDNALSLAYFIKEHHACEILHIKNWNPVATDWAYANGEAPNPHKLFLEKISDNKLDDYIVSFNGATETALEVLKNLHFRFNMMVSDCVHNDIDYVILLELLSKNALHIRYIGDKKISQIKQEAIFQTDMDISFTYAQGYLITGMDYVSLYEQKSTPQKNYQEHEEQQDIHDTHHFDISEEPTWTENGFVYTNISQEPVPSEQETHETRGTNTELTSREERELRRQERRQAREERHKQKILTQENSDNHRSQDTTKTEPNNDGNTPYSPKTHTSFEISDNGDSTISAARRALRERRAMRRMNILNHTSE